MAVGGISTMNGSESGTPSKSELSEYWATRIGLVDVICDGVASCRSKNLPWPIGPKGTPLTVPVVLPNKAMKRNETVNGLPFGQIRRGQLLTPVPHLYRMPSSACNKKISY